MAEKKIVALAEISARISDKIPASTAKQIKGFMRNAMLFNFKTQVRNITGNAAMTPVFAVSDTIGAGIDRAIAKRTKVRTIGLPSAKTFAKGFKQGIVETIDDYKKGIDTSQVSLDRFEVSQGKSFNEKTFVGRWLNKVDRADSLLLRLGDAPFSNGYKLQSLENQMRLNNVTEPTADMIDIATHEAEVKTWQDNNKYVKAINNIKKSANKLTSFATGTDEIGLGDIAVFFSKTPVNIAKANGRVLSRWAGKVYCSRCHKTKYGN